MWVGFNSKYHEDRIPKQIVRYMPNMIQPITSLDTVQETLKLTRLCAKECNQKYGIVTYDLNAAKPAFQIQATENPLYDDIFIMLGPFHIELTFFKAIGKLIAESGGPSLLTETSVLNGGSVHGFLEGKNYNRCKKLHPILALAFEILHINAFLETFGHKDEITDILSRLNEEIFSDVEFLAASVFTNDANTSDHR